MAKHRSPKNESQASVGKSLTVEVALPVLGALSETREAFHELCIRTGQQVLLAIGTTMRAIICLPIAFLRRASTVVRDAPFAALVACSHDGPITHATATASSPRISHCAPRHRSASGVPNGGCFCVLVGMLRRGDRRRRAKRCRRPDRGGTRNGMTG